MKSDCIFTFMPLLDSKIMNLIKISLSFVSIRFYNREFKVSSYLLSMLNFETLNLDKSSYIWPLSDFRTLNLDSIFLSFASVEFYNHEPTWSSYVLLLLDY
jgi:hypothetical protein